jgi:hypothetical protein
MNHSHKHSHLFSKILAKSASIKSQIAEDNRVRNTPVALANITPGQQTPATAVVLPPPRTLDQLLAEVNALAGNAGSEALWFRENYHALKVAQHIALCGKLPPKKPFFREYPFPGAAENHLNQPITKRAPLK